MCIINFLRLVLLSSLLTLVCAKQHNSAFNGLCVKPLIREFQLSDNVVKTMVIMVFFKSVKR